MINGSSREDAMVLGSEDDEPEEDGIPSIDSFNVDEEDSDLSEPYHKILRHIDIHFGTCVRHIAVPHTPSRIRDSTPGAFPPILLSKIVVAAACNDSSIRLVTLPLLPPLPSVDEMSYKGVQMVTVAGTPHEVPSSISITHSAISENSGSPRESSKSRSRSRNRVVEHENTTATSHHLRRSWSFLLISTSATAGGLLATHEIPLVSDTQLSTSTVDLHPIQRCYLGFPCLRSKVVFNPSTFPAHRHSTALVSATDTGYVKVYQVFPDRRSSLSRGRRHSAATTDSASSGMRASSGSAPSNGHFLISFYPGFINSSDSVTSQRRKRILDVSWVASGRAILVLLEDGEWGVWDFEGAGPGPGSANLLRGQNNVSGIQRPALTTFAFSGRIAPASNVLPKTQKDEPRNTKDTSLVPMTPQTRKVRSEGLFRGAKTSFRPELGNAQPTKGHICVIEQGPVATSALSTPAETLIMAYGSNIIYIPSLQTLWRAEINGKGTFDSAESIRPSHFLGLSLGDERLIDVSGLPFCPPKGSQLSFGTAGNETPDLLVVADHRLILFVSPLTEPIPTGGAGTRFPLGLSKAQEPALAKFTDQTLLGQGQLGLEGMDRILDTMRQENGGVNGQGELFGKRAAFDMDDEGDMSIASPTPKAGNRIKRTPQRPFGRNRKGAF
jgi:hypothetical protein